MSDPDNERVERKENNAAPDQPADKEGAKTEQKLIEIAFPTQATRVLVLGNVISLLLIVCAVLVKLTHPVLEIFAITLLALGGGLFLAAWGGQATVRWGAFVAAGVVAISALIFYGVNRYETDLRAEYQKGYVQGTIRDFKSKVFNATLKNRNYIMSRVDGPDEEFSFIVLLSEANETRTRLTLTVKNEELKKQVPKCVNLQQGQDCAFIYDLNTLLFHTAWNGRKSISWKFKSGALYDATTDARIAEALENYSFLPQRLNHAGLSIQSAWDLMTVGRADARAASPHYAMIRKDDPETIKQAFADLTSDDVDTRREARDLLGSGPIAWVRPIADEFKRGFQTYRTKLGCLVALTQILRREKAQVRQVRANIQEDHIDPLVLAAGDADSTVRVYAGEFLFLLGDPRTVLQALELAAKTAGDNARYNLIFLTQGGIKELDSTATVKAALLLKSLVRPNMTKTNALIQTILDSIASRLPPSRT